MKTWYFTLKNQKSGHAKLQNIHKRWKMKKFNAVDRKLVEALEDTPAKVCPETGRDAFCTSMVLKAPPDQEMKLRRSARRPKSPKDRDF